MLGMQYPPVPDVVNFQYGLYPVDFILETIIQGGLDWFLTDPDSAVKVFGHLKDPWLADRYGDAKITEIKNFITKYKIKIVQHFSLVDVEVPSITIQLLDGSEMVERAGLNDFQEQIDTLDVNNMVVGRKEVGYIPVIDNIQIGIHSIQTPDLVKYLYYLVVYILSAFKPDLEKKGMNLGTFRATDLSRLNEFMPENMYSRFINFTVFSVASFDKGLVPIVQSIIGASYPSSTLGGSAVSSDERTDPTIGMRVKDIK